MYSIIGIKAKTTEVSPGELGFDAQAEIRTEDGKTVYADVNWFDALNCYLITEIDGFAYLTGEIDRNSVNFEESIIEEYSSIEEAQESEYASCFTMLDNLVYQMYHGPILDHPDFELGKSSVVIEFNDWLDYTFLATRYFVDDGTQYEARACVSADDYYTYMICCDEKIIELYDDLEMAVKSKWFGVLCGLKHDLVNGMKEYINSHPKKGAKVKEILRRLWM